MRSLLNNQLEESVSLFESVGDAPSRYASMSLKYRPSWVPATATTRLFYADQALAAPVWVSIAGLELSAVSRIGRASFSTKLRLSARFALPWGEAAPTLVESTVDFQAAVSWDF
ncbi:MAG: hypothetical protein GY822_25995 [Deltaproteobacteria bacterium]|nr:hypothetical protein [Deltaproteobacteria bacterium]